MKKKRILALLLTLLMLAPSVISCSETASQETENNAVPSAEETSGDISAESEVETEERLKPNIPEKADYGGDEIRYIFWNISSW